MLMTPQGYWVLGSKAESWTFWLYKVLLQHCLISFLEHVKIIIGWLEEDTGRLEAALENKSKWNVATWKAALCPWVRAGFCIKLAFCSHCTADSNCSPDANCLYCPGSVGCCKVLVSCSSSLEDIGNLYELPHTSPKTLIYLCVCSNKITLSEDLKSTSAVVPSLLPPPY